MVGQVLDERRHPVARAATSRSRHCRYSTTGSTVWENAQPTLRLGPRRALAIGHNGNLVNTRELLDQLPGAARPPPRQHRHGAPDRAPRRRAGRGHGGRAAPGPAAGARRVQPRDPRRAAGHRRARPARVPAARPRAGCRFPAATRPGLWGDDTGRLDPRLGDRGARHRRRRVRARRGARRDRGPRARSRAGLGPLRRGDARPVRLRAHLLRPAGLLHGGPQPVRGPAPDGDPARGRAPGRRGPGDARPGHRGPVRGGVRRGVGDPVPRGHGPQPVQRPDVHPALAGDAPAGRQRQALAPARDRPRPAPDRRRRLHRPRHHHQADRRRCCARRARGRSTSGSAPRRSTIPASTASTRRSRPS